MDLSTLRLFGRTGLRVSPLCLGTMTFGSEWGWGAEKNDSRRVLDAYLDAGGNFVDTANFYTGGTSEKFIGEFLSGRRDRVVLATKYSLCMTPGDANAGGNHRKCLMQSLEASLKRLQTDYIDILWVHAFDLITPIDEIMRALDDVVRSGRVLYIGASNPPAWLAAQANTMAELRGWTEFAGMQVQYSLIERAVERDIAPMCRQFGIGMTPWSPLGGGVLTGKYARLDEGSTEELDASLRKKSNAGRANDRNRPIVEAVGKVAAEAGCTPAQAAIRWLIEKPGVASVILGARTEAQLRDNLGALEVSLPPAAMKTLDDVSAIELGYPHDYLKSNSVQKFLFGGVRIEDPRGR